ncbi:MAG: sugar phosphate isomerase/epimerase [Victivallales bacterium]|nr:sugar phosphate isomerase/epimerase [Victivallales bacterium]
MFQGKIIGASMVYRHFPLRDTMRHMKANGIDEMEITCAGMFTPHFLNLRFMTEREMDENAEEANAAGIHVHCLNIELGFTPGKEEECRNTHLNAFRLAKRYGAEIVTAGAGAVGEGVDTIDGLKKIAAYYNEMSVMAWNEYGIILSVEAPHRNTVSEKYEQLVAYWANMPDRLRCTVDVAHITFADAGIERVISFVGDRLVHVHLRDAEKGNSMIPYGEGKVDFKKVFRLLDKHGYKGKCSLEFPAGEKIEDATGALLKGIEYLEAKRKESAK